MKNPSHQFNETTSNHPCIQKLQEISKNNLKNRSRTMRNQNP
jgi:hypothetical protein